MSTDTHHQAATVAQVKPGEFVRLKDTPGAPVWIRGAYDRTAKAYELTAWADIGHSITRKATARVFVGFTF